MAGMCHSKKWPSQHCWLVPWSKLFVSACIKYVMVRNVNFSIADCVVSRSNLSSSAWNVSCSKKLVVPWTIWILSQLLRLSGAGEEEEEGNWWLLDQGRLSSHLVKRKPI
jgi:hypothetical protein